MRRSVPSGPRGRLRFQRLGASVVIAIAAGLLAACLKPSPPPPGSIGPSGGIVDDPSGVQLTFPPGSVANSLTVSVTRADMTAPAGYALVGPAFVLGPEGSQFGREVTLSLPLDPIVSSGVADVVVATAPAGSSDFVLLPASRTADAALTLITHFSVFGPLSQAVPDGGASDAGVVTDSGPVLDAGALLDAGVPADASTLDSGTDGGCSAPDSGSTCPYENSFSGDDAGCWGAPICTDNVVRSINCSGNSCICAGPNGTSTTFPAPPNACDFSVLQTSWNCGCGYPTLTPPACPVPDGGWTFPVDAGGIAILPGCQCLPPGATCFATDECQAGSVCFNTGTYGNICLVDCTNGETCPCGFLCHQWYPGASACFPI